MFLLYPIMSVAGISITILAWIINPILVLLVDDNGNLPRYLSYFQTFDAPIPKGYREGLAWLNRNPSYGFDMFVFGIPWHPEDWAIRKYTVTPEYELFFATNKYGAFSFKYHHVARNFYLKLGWKVFNYIDPSDGSLNGGSWRHDFNRVPIC
jgi:hypothetical protein